MTLGDIIKKYREEHDMSMDAFATKSGLSKAYISILEKNQHPKTGKPVIPSVTSMQSAANGMNMDVNDLFSLVDGYVTLSQAPDIPDYPNIHPIGIQRYPVLGSVACGKPVYMAEERELYVDSTVAVHADFVLIAKGDSMTGARINDGDIVFIRQQPEVENGEIAVVAIDDEATLKRFYKYSDLIVLRAENPEYKDIELRPEDHKEIHVLGKAVAFQSDVR